MNVLLLIADSLRAENTSSYGYRRNTTPFLDELAEESVVYDTAVAPSVWSLPSHASIWTGLHADQHRLYSTRSALDDYDTVWSGLRDRGYSTAVFSETRSSPTRSSVSRPDLTTS